MKINRLLLFTLFSFLTFVVNAQDSTSVEIEFTDNELKSNEIKLNLGYTLLGHPEITYERILGNNSSIGISFLYSLNNESDVLEDINYSITPYYRLFFSQKPAAGFFFEGTGVIYQEEGFYDFLAMEVDKFIGLGLGLSIGMKLLNESGWHGELVFGLSRVFTDRSQYDFFPRVGINLGKRFY